MKFFYILTPVAIDKVWLGAQWDHSPTSLDTTFKNGLDHHLDHIFQTYLWSYLHQSQNLKTLYAM